MQQGIYFDRKNEIDINSEVMQRFSERELKLVDSAIYNCCRKDLDQSVESETNLIFMQIDFETE